MGKILRFLIPHTLEQSLGLGFLTLAILLIPRPFLAGVMNLHLTYTFLPIISPQWVGATLALFGGIMIIKQRCGRKLFAVLFSPLPMYALALSLFCVQNEMVGAAGAIGYWGLTISVAWMYRKRATHRELGIGEWA